MKIIWRKGYLWLMRATLVILTRKYFLAHNVIVLTNINCHSFRDLWTDVNVFIASPITSNSSLPTLNKNSWRLPKLGNPHFGTGTVTRQNSNVKAHHNSIVHTPSHCFPIPIVPLARQNPHVRSSEGGIAKGVAHRIDCGVNVTKSIEEGPELIRDTFSAGCERFQ